MKLKPKTGYLFFDLHVTNNQNLSKVTRTREQLAYANGQEWHFANAHAWALANVLYSIRTWIKTYFRSISVDILKV